MGKGQLRTFKVMISIVVVSYRSTAVLRKCLNALQSQIDSGDEVFVIENSKDQALCNWSVFEMPNFHLTINEVNTGYTAGCNQGLSSTKNEWALLLNPDAYPMPGAIKQLKKELQSKEVREIFAVELVNLDGSRQDYFRRFPSVRALIIMFFVPLKWQANFSAYRRYTYHTDFESRDSFEQPPGAGLVVPSSIRLDEDFFIYGSDLMFCWENSQKSKSEVQLLPASFVHLRGQGGTNSSSDLADWLRVESAQGFALFFFKSGQRIRRQIWMVCYGLGEFCGILWSLLFKHEQYHQRASRLKKFLKIV